MCYVQPAHACDLCSEGERADYKVAAMIVPPMRQPGPPKSVRRESTELGTVSQTVLMPCTPAGIVSQEHSAWDPQSEHPTIKHTARTSLGCSADTEQPQTASHRHPRTTPEQMMGFKSCA